MAFLLDDTTLKVENYIIVIEFYKLEFSCVTPPQTETCLTLS